MEPSFVEAFKYSPIFFLLTTVAGGAGLLLGVIGLAFLGKSPKASIVLGLLAALAASAAISFGIFGWWVAVSRAEVAAASPGLSATDRARLTAYGRAEASYSLIFGAAVGALPFIAGIAAAGIGLARRKRQ